MASSTPSVCGLCGEDNEEHLRVMVFSTGAVIEYTVPSFPVFTVEIREMKYQFVVDDEQESNDIYDGYLNTDGSTSMSLPSPALAKVCSGYKYGFFIDNEEFERSDVPFLPAGRNLFLGKVFVMWKWEWEYINTSVNDGSITEKQEEWLTDEDKLDHSTEETEETINHTIVFKCVGCNKSMATQELLASVSKRIHNEQPVSIRILPEPNNPKDARAIRFECSLNEGQEWNPIGYVVQEALDSVHLALERKEMIPVTFAWVKFVMHWSSSGPGWYCGVKMTKRGLWSKEVIQCRSTI